MPKKSKPKWWQLIALLPLMIGMLFLETRIQISPPEWHQAIQVGIVLFIYGAMGFWLRANSAALADEDRTAARVLRISIYRNDESQSQPRKTIPQPFNDSSRAPDQILRELKRN